MDWRELLAVLALVVIAISAGGAAVRLWAMVGATAVTVTMLLVAALVLVVVLGTAWSLRRASTTYW